MRKYLLASAAILGAAALATPALADVQVTGTIHKDEIITVLENIVKVKVVTITVAQTFTGTTAAEATSIYNQRNNGNVLRRDVDGVPTPEGVPNPLTFSCGPCGSAAVTTASINGSFHNNTGVVMWNQDAGENVNQANNVTLAVVANAFFAEATSAAEQRSENNVSFVVGIFPLVTKVASITGSVNNNTGITLINQNAGFASNQYNAVTGAIGLDGARVALADADLGQWSQNNRTYDFGTNRQALISGSVNANTGVTAVNQNVGNFNNQATTISFSGGR